MRRKTAMIDVSVFIGIISGCYLLLTAIGIETGMKLFYHPASMLIVLGGTVCATLVHFPVTQLFKLYGRLKVVFKPSAINYKKDIDHIMKLSNTYRQESRLALEKELPKINDHFLKHGLELLIDNVDPDEIKNMLEKNLSFIEIRHEQGIHFFDTMAQYAPGFGFMGTLIGLVMLLSELENPENLGPSMSTALVTTFYGILLANLIFLPLAGRLRIVSNEEVVQKKMYIEGIYAMANNETNYMVFEKMTMCLPDKERKKVGDSKQKPSAKKNA
ncbi:motility protein A [Candidatus Marinamargulisbacteria bacterium SCGC AAA071-K20]|nr:motility protein A [Candidatus Marinamargulisbacteria bacterium SCGC AAA071-K20]